jgi:DNA-directed RNA polymerase specialized sigma24 family protein
MGQNIGLFTRRQYADAEVVEALQRRERQMEEWFYHRAKRYFDDHFNAVFFDKDRKQEIFQSGFLKLWMEIDNRRIRVEDGLVCRQQADGRYTPLTCSLTTFLMAFARTEHRELVRSTKEETYAELFDDVEYANVMQTSFDSAEDIDEQKNRIIDACIQQMSPTCVEILTLFYYKEKSLDEILEIRKDKNSSKNGLKTAKNKCMNTLRERVQAKMAALQR